MIKIIEIKDEYKDYFIDCSDGNYLFVTKQELKSLHTKISKILGIVDFKKEMVEDKGKFINNIK